MSYMESMSKRHHVGAWVDAALVGRTSKDGCRAVIGEKEDWEIIRGSRGQVKDYVSDIFMTSKSSSL